MVGDSVVTENLEAIDVVELLNEKGYSSEETKELMEKDILFLATNERLIKLDEDRELLTLETVELKKILVNKLKDAKIEFPLDKKRGHRYVALFHSEIFVGLVVFIGLTAWEISKGIISNWLYDKFKDMKRDSKTLNAKLEIQVVDKRNQRSYHVKYSGPADKVSELIKKTKLK